MPRRREDTLFMETTEVSPSRSAGEITDCLIQSGASQIATDYKNAKIVGLRWTMSVGGSDKLFCMPARIDPVFAIFKERAERSSYGGKRCLSAAALITLREKAERVAWRQLLRWVQAQLAMIQTGMVRPEEVFLPYWQPTGEGRTLFDLISANKFKALPAADEKTQ